MKAIILIGVVASSGSVENIYTGLDGVACEQAAEAAAKRGTYSAIGRINNPSVIPQPVTGTPTTATKPTFPANKPKIVVTKKQKPNPLDENNALLRKQREYRLKQFNSAKDLQKPEEKKGQEQKDQNALREDGPTLEEFMAGGGLPDAYPPQGFAPKESAAWKMYQEQRELSAKSKSGIKTEQKPGKPAAATQQ